jgi:hypothetical protein
MKSNRVFRAAAALWLLTAAPAIAQTTAQPGFRDEKTGKVWTPDNVGQDGKPAAPEDRAFDPSGQAVVMQGSVERNVPTRPIGRVPITAGPNVPLVEVNDIKLRETPGRSWVVEAHVNNNSPAVQKPVIGCDYLNGQRTVERVTAELVPVGSGERVSIVVRGPKSEVFVDSAHCFVEQP